MPKVFISKENFQQQEAITCYMVAEGMPFEKTIFLYPERFLQGGCFRMLSNELR